MNDTHFNQQQSVPQVQLLTVGEEDAGQRLDNYLLARLKGVPRTHVYKLVRKGEVRVNKKRPSADQRLQAGDVVRVPPVRVAQVKAAPVVARGTCASLNDSVLLEDDSLLILNKAPGWAVHGGSEISLGVIEAVRQCREHAGRYGLVHRLDRDTSGVLVIAKKPSVLKKVQAEWDKAQKRYVALVSGCWPAGKRWVDAPLKKNVLQSGERVVRVAADGKPSLSEFSVMQTWHEVTQVGVLLHTGRTHQIRVHAQFSRHPLLGDERYMDDAARQLSRTLGVRRLMLHAAQLQLPHPVTGEVLVIEAPLPDDMLAVVARLSHSG